MSRHRYFLVALAMCIATYAWPQGNCEQFRRNAEIARRNSNTGVRSNDSAQVQAAEVYERAYAACTRGSSGGGGGAGPTLGDVAGRLGDLANTMQRARDNDTQWSAHQAEQGRQDADRKRAEQKARAAGEAAEDDRRRHELANPFGSSTTAQSNPFDTGRSTPAGQLARTNAQPQPASAAPGPIQPGGIREPKAGTALGKMLFEEYRPRLVSPNQCIRDLASAGEFLVLSAETCRANGVNLESQVEVADLPDFERVDPARGINKENGVRWLLGKDENGRSITAPNCYVPLSVGNQKDAQSECVRVNLCATRSISCAIKGIEAAGGKANCEAIVSACMAKYPIPEGMAADGPAINRQPPPEPAPRFEPSRSDQGTISGPTNSHDVSAK